MLSADCRHLLGSNQNQLELMEIPTQTELIIVSVGGGAFDLQSDGVGLSLVWAQTRLVDSPLFSILTQIW